MYVFFVHILIYIYIYIYKMQINIQINIQIQIYGYVNTKLLNSLMNLFHMQKRIKHSLIKI